MQMLGRLRGAARAPVRLLQLRPSSSAVYELLRFVRSPAGRENPDQAVDILRSGAAHHGGTDTGRIQLTLAEASLDRGDFGQAVAAAEAAAAACQPGSASGAGQALAADIQQAAAELAVRAQLTCGQDSQALETAASALRAAQQPPEGLALALRWRLSCEATARLAIAHLAAGQAAAAEPLMQQLQALAESRDPAAAPAAGEAADRPTLPMRARDIGIPGALLRTGLWHFTQGDRVQAGRQLQRAAMAAEAQQAQSAADSASAAADPAAAAAADPASAAAADPASAAAAEAAGAPPLTPGCLRETLLAAFSAHVQSELAAAADQTALRQAEVHLENALQKAEELGGSSHVRILPTLMHLAEVFARTGRVTLAEGLYRKAAKMLWRSPTPGAPFLPLRPCLPVHASLAALLCWRHAQLLAALPKRGGEAAHWQAQAQQLYAEAVQPAWGRPIEHFLGGLEALKGGSGQPAGVAVDCSLLRAIPCARPLLQPQRQGSDSEHEDVSF